MFVFQSRAGVSFDSTSLLSFLTIIQQAANLKPDELAGSYDAISLPPSSPPDERNSTSSNGTGIEISVTSRIRRLMAEGTDCQDSDGLLLPNRTASTGNSTMNGNASSIQVQVTEVRAEVLTESEMSLGKLMDVASQGPDFFAGITDSHGNRFVRCGTTKLNINERVTVIASPPPLKAGSSNLAIELFLNVSAPGTKALSLLISQSADTIWATVVATVATSMLRSFAGGRTIVGPEALAGAQRLALIAALSGPSLSCEGARASAHSLDWTMGRFGVVFGACDSQPARTDGLRPPWSRRRIEQSVRPSFTLSAFAPPAAPLLQDDEYVTHLMVSMLRESLAWLIIVMAGVVGTHYAILLAWARLVNCQYYHWLNQRKGAVVDASQLPLSPTPSPPSAFDDGPSHGEKKLPIERAAALKLQALWRSRMARNHMVDVVPEGTTQHRPEDQEAFKPQSLWQSPLAKQRVTGIMQDIQSPSCSWRAAPTLQSQTIMANSSTRTSLPVSMATNSGQQRSAPLLMPCGANDQLGSSAAKKMTPLADFMAKRGLLPPPLPSSPAAILPSSMHQAQPPRTRVDIHTDTNPTRPGLTRTLRVRSGRGESLGIGLMRLYKGWLGGERLAIAYVNKDSPLAGLVEPGEHIIRIDGETPRWLRTRHGVQKLAARLTAADVIQIRLWRPVGHEPNAWAQHHPYRTRPHFYSLPAALVWPNPEIVIVACFSCGLLQCSTACAHQPQPVPSGLCPSASIATCLRSSASMC